MEGMRREATSTPFSEPSTAPARHAARPATGAGNPNFESSPAVTPQIAKIEPTEMSICPISITSVMPSATIRTGTLARNKSVRFSREK